MKLSSSLVFYIGNGVVKASVVINEKGMQPRIISTLVRDLPHYSERDRGHLEKRILSVFGEITRDLKSSKIQKLAHMNLKIENAFVILSSPWYTSETSIIKIKEQKPFMVTDELLHRSKENITKGYRDAHEVDVVVLEQKIINISLNGYPTNEPLKKKAEALDMTIFTSFARKSSMDQIQDIIDSNFHVKNTSINSQALVSFTVISDMWHNISQYIIADITSELTELISVRKGILSETYSFPKGKKFLVETIAKELEIATEVAESLLRMKNAGQIESELSIKIDTALKSAKKEWLKGFSKSLAALSTSSSLPSNFFLFSPKDVTSTFSEFIGSEEYQQFTFAEGKFVVKSVRSTDLLPYCKVENGAVSDLSLMIGAIFNSKMRSL